MCCFWFWGQLVGACQKHYLRSRSRRARPTLNFCVVERFVAEGAKERMAAGDPCSEGHITDDQTQTRRGSAD